MWEELYEKLYPELRRYAAAACKNEAEAEDVAQEVFLKALQNVSVFEDLSTGQRRAWLYRTLKNEMVDRYRRAKREEAFLELQREEGILDPGIQAIENRLFLEILSPEDRALFYLRYEDGYSATELAELFRLPTGTIRSRLSRCRMLLKTMLK